MASFSPEHVFSCARLLRAGLYGMLTQTEADLLDVTLAEWLAQPINDNTSANLRAHWAQYEKTRTWAREYLEWASPLRHDTPRNYPQPLGDHSITAAIKFACPKCRFPWRQRTIGQIAGQCARGCKVRYEPIIALYICPKNDLVWPIFDEQTPIPKCRTHQVALVRIS